MQRHTFQVEQDVGLVILEHLSDELYIHVLDVDLLCAHSQSPNLEVLLRPLVANLETLVHHHDCFI